MNPQQALELLQSSLARHQVGDLESAAGGYQKVLAAYPTNADALHLMGVLEGQRGRADVGLTLMRRAIAVLPTVGDFHRHHGELLAALKRHEEALPAFARAIQLNPRDGIARSEAAASLFALNKIPEAVEQFRLAWEALPDNGAIAGNYGYGLLKVGRGDEAVRVLHRATQLAPNDSSPWLQLAEVLWRMGRYQEAIGPARHGAAMAPNDVRALLVLGNTLQTLAEFQEAVDVYQRVIAIEPDNFDANSNMALTLLKMGEAQRSLDLYQGIARRWPDNNDALANRSLAMLTLGDLEGGFREYETRWRSAAFQNKEFNQPRWDGSDPAAKTILLMSEQGLGDTLQFVRYAPLVAQRGATVLVSCPAELRGVIETVKGITRIFTSGQPLPRFDAHAPMASLPVLFKTTIESIPANVPYVSADPARVRNWRDRLRESPGLKVGIAWAGSPLHQNDRARSCKLADFAPLAAVEGVAFFSLQKGLTAAEAKNPPAGMNVQCLGDELRDFTDTAALLECLDLLISVDTSVVHLAGALGRPVWTLLARGPDWRWMLERSDTPWYPTMRLFRQRNLGDWSTVFVEVAEQLRHKSSRIS